MAIAMSAVALESQDHVEGSGVAIVSQDSLLMVDGIERRAVVVDPHPAILVGVESRDRHRSLRRESGCSAQSAAVSRGSNVETDSANPI